MGYTVTAVSTASQKNRGGVVLNGGNVPGTGPITRTLGIAHIGLHSGKYGSAMVSGTYNIFVKSNGTFGVLTQGKYVGPFICSQLAGVSNTALRNPGGHRYVRQPKGSTRTITYGTFNYVTGKPATTTSTAHNFYSIAAGDSAANADNAAFPTKSVPGELVILETGKTPSYKDYSTKNT